MSIPSASRSGDDTRPITSHAYVAQRRRATACPRCLFVHGSGPNDQDETIGPNRPSVIWRRGSPFGELRRFATTSAPAFCRAISRPCRRRPVKDEVLDDVAAALRRLRLEEDLADSKLSSSATVLARCSPPRIAAESGDVSGLAMLPLPPCRWSRSCSPSSNISKPFRRRGSLESVFADVARIRGACPGDAGPPFLGAPLSWWADVNSPRSRRCGSAARDADADPARRSRLSGHGFGFRAVSRGSRGPR